MKLNEKCKDWETDINNLKKELLDIDKMNLDDTNLHINKIDVEVDDSIDLNKYGIIECILLLLTTFFLLVFLIKNHK